MELAGVILPDGRIDSEGSKFVNPDVKLEPIEFPVVSSVDRIQSHYESERLAGLDHDHAIVNVYWASFGPLPDGLKTLPQRQRYREMRVAGESHNMAEMLATRSFPGLRTDAIFNEGRFSSDAGKVGPEQLWLKQQAEAAGVSTNGKWYCRGLASFPGDPTAWVSDRGDVLRVAREKNMNVEGYVEHKAHHVDPGDDISIADDIIESEVREILEACPEANADDVREEVYAVRTGAVDNNPLCVED